jgi:thiol-disulfide isomerase/thioredoxin
MTGEYPPARPTARIGAGRRRLAAFAACCLLLPAGASAQEAIGRMDYGWRIAALDGTAIPLRAYRGEVLFINVWATWCRSCVTVLPSVQALHDRYASRGVRFLTVAADRPGAVERFQRRYRLALPIFLELDAIPRELGVAAVPTTLIVDREGRVLLRHRGAADWNRPEVHAFLEALLAPESGRRPGGV